MKNVILVVFLLAALLAACNTVPAPQITPTTASTATISPTDTKTPSATGTTRPTITHTATETPQPTETPKPKLTKTPKPKAFYGCFTPNGVKGKNAPFKLEARTSKRVVVYINGLSRNGNHPIYCSEIVRQGIPKILTLMWGDYTYMVQVGGKTTMRGSFFINNPDKATMRVFENKIAIGPFP